MHSPAPVLSPINQLLVRGVPGGTFKEEDVVHQSIHVVRERETVMDQVMEELMMAMLDVCQVWCAAATTVRSLDTTIMRKMTAVRDLDHLMFLDQYISLAGGHGAASQDVLHIVLMNQELRLGQEGVKDQDAEDHSSLRKEFVSELRDVHSMEAVLQHHGDGEAVVDTETGEEGERRRKIKNKSNVLHDALQNA